MKDYKGYLFDIDGTIVLGDVLIPGAKEKIEELRKCGKKIGFYTNNSSKNPKSYIEKFTKLGIETELKEIITAGGVLADYLKNSCKDKKIFMVGTKDYKNYCKDLEIQILDENDEFDFSEIDIVVVTLDSELSYKKLEIACKLLHRNVEYLAANEDLVYPVEDGVFLPDCRAICNIIELCTKKIPKYFGKPKKAMLDYALRNLNLLKDEVVIVGDRLYTDIASGYINGCDTILVLTGEAKRDSKSVYNPTYILDSVADI
ncbi:MULTISPECIES: HAD-IIA family hydrolase [Cetobacterium]|uniref:HAD-IIA family hydrolase n=3 Tax=Fusobacteriaceae TaxID=203492 RepID=UPI001F06EEE4|nr:HAD-IIA family hydrolase [Cetobacterium somerae]UPO98782.1 HAD-IIA family hydrolase [Cetobacterium somerae]